LPIVMPFPMTAQEMRVLQEFRRLAAETLPLPTVKALKHPAGGGEGPVLSLVDKGYLTTDSARESFTLTEKAKEFLAIDWRPTAEASAAGDQDEA
jgi:hypothetical protein